MVRRMARPLVCIPTYNEASNILPLVELVHEAAPDADVLVIDDASPDGTGDLVRDRMLKDARLELMARPTKLGLGTAYMAGFAFGLQHDYDSVLTMDSDFSHPPDRIPALMAARSPSPWSARCRSEEHTSELQSRLHLVCRLLLEKKKKLELTLAAPRLIDHVPAPALTPERRGLPHRLDLITVGRTHRRTPAPEPPCTLHLFLIAL